MPPSPSMLLTERVSSKPTHLHTHTYTHSLSHVQDNALWQRPQTSEEDQFFTQCATDIHKIRPQKREGEREEMAEKIGEEGEKQRWS